MMYKTRRKLRRSVQFNANDKGWKITQWRVKWDRCVCVYTEPCVCIRMCYPPLCLHVSRRAVEL